MRGSADSPRLGLEQLRVWFVGEPLIFSAHAYKNYRAGCVGCSEMPPLLGSEPSMVLRSPLAAVVSTGAPFLASNRDGSFYERRCASCHGLDGGGREAPGPSVEPAQPRPTTSFEPGGCRCRTHRLRWFASHLCSRRRSPACWFLCGVPKGRVRRFPLLVPRRTISPRDKTCSSTNCAACHGAGGNGGAATSFGS